MAKNFLQLWVQYAWRLKLKHPREPLRYDLRADPTYVGPREKLGTTAIAERPALSHPSRRRAWCRPCLFTKRLASAANQAAITTLAALLWILLGTTTASTQPIEDNVAEVILIGNPGEEGLASPGDAIVRRMFADMVPGYRLKQRISSRMPGAMKVYFSFEIDASTLACTTESSRWMYCAAPPGAARASFKLLGNVMAPGDTAGIRVRKNGDDMEWYVDNSYHNGRHPGGVVWSRNLNKDEFTLIEPVEGGVPGTIYKIEEISFDGHVNGILMFSRTTRRTDETERKVFQFSAASSGSTLVNVAGSFIECLDAGNLGLKYRIVDAANASGKPSDASHPAASTGGTCFAVSDDGRILTAYHVVDGASRVQVRFEGGEPESARIEATSAASDLAVLRISRPTRDFLPLVSAATVAPGETVFTVGFPVPDILGSAPKYTDGTVSAMTGVGGEASLMQVSIPVQPGNSGGPVLTERGEVVGIVTSSAAVQRFLAETGTLPQNVNWAVKSDYAMPLVGRPEGAAHATSRSAAVAQAMKAVCLVEAETR